MKKLLLFLLLLPFFTKAQTYGNGRYAHPAYIAVLDRATSDGFTKPSHLQRLKHCALIRNLDSKDDVWRHKEVYYNFINDGSEEFGYYNWVDPNDGNNVATKGGTTTWTSNNGVAGNGSTGVYTTNYFLGEEGKYTQNDASMTLDIITVSTSGANTYYFGVNDATSDSYTFINQGNGTRLNAPAATTVTPSSPGAGFWTVIRDNSADIDFYKNGSSTNLAVAQTSDVPSTNNVSILARYNGVSNIDHTNGRIGQLSFGRSMSSTEIAAEYASWNIFKSAP